MCGIAGFFNPDKTVTAFNADKILSELMFVNQLRGRDAVGMFGQHRSVPEYVAQCKMVGPTDEFFNWDVPHKEIFKKAEYFRFVVSHVRSATIGDRNKIEAAHPHLTKNITLVHNGTLTWYKDKNEHVSDSAAIAKALEENASIAEAQKDFFGAWALVWHDKRNNSLNFIRNVQRPLAFAKDRMGVWWFASELKMLEWILDRNNKVIDKSFELKDMTLLSLTNDNVVEESTIPLPASSCTTSLSIWKGRGRFAGMYRDRYDYEQGKRASETIKYGKKQIKGWDDCRVQYTNPPSPPPLPKKENEGTLFTKVKGKVKALTDWNGLSAGDKVYFFPVQIGLAPKDKDRTILAGPLCVFNNEVGPTGIEFVNGVEVRSRLDEELEEEGNGVNVRHRLTIAREVCEAIITAIVQDLEGKRLVIYCKDAIPQDWFCIDDWEIDMTKQILPAWRAPYPEPTAAPEVAAIEKKFEDTAKPSSNSVH